MFVLSSSRSWNLSHLFTELMQEPLVSPITFLVKLLNTLSPFTLSLSDSTEKPFIACSRRLSSGIMKKHHYLTITPRKWSANSYRNLHSQEKNPKFYYEKQTRPYL